MSSQSESWQIGEVAKRAGLKTSAIRFYERTGLLPKAERVSGRRCYDVSVLDRLAVIELAKEAGFTLAEIRVLLDGFSPDTSPSARWQKLARDKIPEVEALVARAEGMKRLLEEGLRCDCLSLDQCGTLLRSNARPR